MLLTKIATIATDLVVSAGVGTIVGNAIKATTPTDMKMLNKIFVTVGSVVLSGAAAAKASEFVLNQAAATAAEFKKNMKNSQQDINEN